MGENWRYVFVVAIASGPAYFFEGSPGILSAPILGFATILVPYLLAVWRLGHRRTFRGLLLGSSAALGAFSILTGYLNYLTDEWATPQIVSLLLAGHDWYTLPLQYQYIRMGRTFNATLWNVYLPLLPLVQIPYVWLDYRWFMLGLWGLMVYAVRRRYYTSLALGGQYPALMAANGFNDLVPLLFLTLAVVTLRGSRARAVKFFSLGMKQFANVFVFLYHVLRREWGEAVLTLVVSFLFLIPFLIWDWKSAICTPILDMPPDCGNTQNLIVNSVHSRINFALWPVWIIAVFYPVLIPEIGHLGRRLKHSLIHLRTKLGLAK